MLIHFNEPEHTIKNSLSKAKFIKRHKPDVIIFEYPIDSFNVRFFNRYSPRQKPLCKIIKWKKDFQKDLKKYPWLKGDIEVAESIISLWGKGKRVYLFNMDAPTELTSLCDQIVKKQDRFYFDVWNFLRELHMVKIIRAIKSRFPKKKIVIFCHSSHWKNIRFLLSHTLKEYPKRYFKNYSKKDFLKLRLNNKIAKLLLKYYKKSYPSICP